MNPEQFQLTSLKSKQDFIEEPIDELYCIPSLPYTPPCPPPAASCPSKLPIPLRRTTFLSRFYRSPYKPLESPPHSPQLQSHDLEEKQETRQQIISAFATLRPLTSIFLLLLNAGIGALFYWIQSSRGCAVSFRQLMSPACIARTMGGQLCCTIIVVFQFFAEAKLYNRIWEMRRGRAAGLAVCLLLPLMHLFFGSMFGLIGWAITKREALNAIHILLVPLIGSGVNFLMGVLIVRMCQ